jgi:GT2 family glycosyltransferase
MEPMGPAELTRSVAGRQDQRKILSVLVDTSSGYHAPAVDRIDGARYARALGLQLSEGRPVAEIDLTVPHAGLAWTDLVPGGGPAGRTRPGNSDSIGEEAAAPLVSVVVPTIFKRAEGLHRCLASVLASTGVRLDVVVVDNRARPEDPLELSPDRFAGVRVVHEPKPGISAARNTGIRAALGDVVAFTDDDVEVTPWWLAALHGALDSHAASVAAVGMVHPARLDTEAAELFESSGARAEKCLTPYVYQGPALRERHGATRSEAVRVGEAGPPAIHSLLQVGGFGMGCNMAFRRPALLSRPFDEALGTGTPCHGGEDIARLLQVLLYEGEIVYEPSAIILHDHRDSMEALRRQMYAYGCGFSAALASLTMSDWRLLWALGRGVLPAIGRFFQPTSDRNSARAVSAEWRDLSRRELSGLLAGPFEYARTRLASLNQRGPAPAVQDG